MKYDVQEIEKKWQQYWEKHPFHAKPTGSGKKYYCLDMFPYPSGSGLHVGHWRGYVLSDVYARIRWLQGYNVLHPMGWDAFGLPAENDAIKKGIHPALSTAVNIKHFKEQLKAIGALYDWSKEINTTAPNYYHWTQWIFLKMYEAGLAYEAEMPINWCPSCLTGLANEEVVDGGCERCGTLVEQKKIRQWMLRITEYAEKLLEGLDKLDWPEKVKTMQRNWIGKSEGAEIIFKVQATNGSLLDISVYTTRADTLYGVTFLVLAPEHEAVPSIVTSAQQVAVQHYQKELSHVIGAARLEQMHEKTGVFTGAYAINPINNEKVPVYLANYVLKDYGTGAVMGVPAHCQRDFEFAQKYNIPIKQVLIAADNPVIIKNLKHATYEDDISTAVLINSDDFNGLTMTTGKKAIVDALVKRNVAERKINYKLRDWIFSRQRYWGEPIPIIHCTQCGTVPVPEDQLPVTLPEVENYQPTGTGESPLAAIDWWVNTICPRCGGNAQRETNTMPQWAGSSWYFLRYPNPQLKTAAFDKRDMEYWLPVDLYVGGIEHAILHLLYARFYTKVLHDQGYLLFDEPFKQLFNQGMVCKFSEKTGKVEKMSKSKGNVVNPDEIVQIYGSDVLRMYILFVGPPELDCEWQDTGLDGIRRFLQRFWTYMTDLKPAEQEGLAATKRLHRMLKMVHDRLDAFKPNTAIAALMEWLNDAIAENMQLSTENIEKVLVTLSIFAPHTASELLEALLNKKLSDCTWPIYDIALASVAEITIAVQVSGKTRSIITVAPGAPQEQVEKLARQVVAKWFEGKALIKTIFVPDKLINFVLK